MSSSNDSNAIASFNKTHPLDFNLYEGENKEPVIFIENGTKGQELILEIVNDSGQPIGLPSKNAMVSPNNYHFELRFRPDTLSPNSLQKLALQPNQNWSMGSPVSQADGLVSLYFLKTNDQPLNANHTESLTIQNINGAAAGGARTTRAELMCPQFTYQGETFNNYYREKSLSIVSNRGKKNIPLHVGFVGSNRILNDGASQNTLNLRITNVSKDRTIPFNPISRDDQASKLTISFDIDSPWALGTKDQVEQITISSPSPDWQINQGNEGASPIWTITNNQDTGLAAEQAIELTIGNIISSLPSGNTNLYLRYENIPGYWDGTFICTVEKMPIWYDINGNVGIGTTNLDGNKLKVQGNADIAGALNAQGNANITGSLTAHKIEGIGAFVQGMVIMWSGEIRQIPSGWVLCDGKRGDIPDLSGRFVLGVGRGNLLTEKFLNDMGGSESVRLTVEQIPPHTHNGTTNQGEGEHTHNLWKHFRSFDGNDDPDKPLKDRKQDGDDPIYNPPKGSENHHQHTFTTDSTGGGSDHENMPPFYVLAYIQYRPDLLS